MSISEKSLCKEKLWLEEQVRVLKEELDKKNIEVMAIHRDNCVKNLNLQTDLAEKVEQVISSTDHKRILLWSVNSIKLVTYRM
jgi:hypothetical protein